MNFPCNTFVLNPTFLAFGRGDWEFRIFHFNWSNVAMWIACTKQRRIDVHETTESFNYMSIDLIWYVRRMFPTDYYNYIRRNGQKYNLQKWTIDNRPRFTTNTHTHTESTTLETQNEWTQYSQTSIHQRNFTFFALSVCGGEKICQPSYGTGK